MTAPINLLDGKSSPRIFVYSLEAEFGVFVLGGRKLENADDYGVNAFAIPEYAKRHEKTTRKVAQTPIRTR